MWIDFEIKRFLFIFALLLYTLEIWSFLEKKVCTNKKFRNTIYSIHSRQAKKFFFFCKAAVKGEWWCSKNESFFHLSKSVVTFSSSLLQRTNASAARWPKTWKSKNELCTLHQELVKTWSVRIQNFFGWQNCHKHSGFRWKWGLFLH